MDRTACDQVLSQPELLLKIAGYNLSMLSTLCAVSRTVRHNVLQAQHVEHGCFGNDRSQLAQFTFLSRLRRLSSLKLEYMCATAVTLFPLLLLLPNELTCLRLDCNDEAQQLPIVLRLMTRLRSLDLDTCGPHSLQSFTALTNLTYLGLAAEFTSVRGVECYTGLRSLRICHCDETVRARFDADISTLVHLDTLELDNCKGLPSLTALTALTSVYTSHCEGTVQLPLRLRTLHCSGTGSSSLGVHEGLTALRRIDIDMLFDGEEFEGLPLPPSLTYLRLGFANDDVYRNGPLQWLTGLANLRTLRLERTGFKNISALTALKRLTALHVVSEHRPPQLRLKLRDFPQLKLLEFRSAYVNLVVDAR